MSTYIPPKHCPICDDPESLCCCPPETLSALNCEEPEKVVDRTRTLYRSLVDRLTKRK